MEFQEQIYSPEDLMKPEFLVVEQGLPVSDVENQKINTEEEVKSLEE